MSIYIFAVSLLAVLILLAELDGMVDLRWRSEK